ncbi:PREDICTED: uncharacterized protein LOC109173044 [Ipomoea nil]|uniref:uncharacterized protein LOC109173044 n=1 Tax=Ipomoea nil TaxID=35883 RepID=UPI000900B6F9|nr:PREDICTED: uncharacterized protein LOC109173044 [Ipomoea nil]
MARFLMSGLELKQLASHGAFGFSGKTQSPLIKKLFADLSQKKLIFQGAWVSLGDYNSVLDREETSSTDSYALSRCADFQDWISRQGLIDLGFSGPKFTWMRGLNSPNFKGARLDRALCNIEWRLRFSEAEFRFNAAWCSHPDYQNCVLRNWNPKVDLDHNLKALTKQLGEWNKQVFGNIHQRKRCVLARLSGVQRCLAIQQRANLISLDRKLRQELNEILHQEELLWFQRSREEWITSGDRNTRFYHAATTVRRSTWIIKRLKDDTGE